MAEKRSFADFSRFSFVESSGSSGVSDNARTNSTDVSTEPMRARVLPQVPTKKPKSAAIGDNNQVQPAAAGLSELYKSVDCIERPLRLLIIGHNPSDQSWSKGHYYANPSNRMWFLLGKSGIVPSNFKADCDKRCPDEVGVGFTDVMSGIPDTQSCNITDSTLKSYKSTFFKRLEAHTQRVATECQIAIDDAYPRVIAFAGVRQWKALFPAGYFDEGLSSTSKKERSVPKNQPLLTNMFSHFKPSTVANDGAVDVEAALAGVASESAPEGSTANKPRQSTIPYGVQTQRPEGWPAVLRQSVVFLLPSSSGAAAMSNAEREGPYLELGALLQQEQYRWVAGSGLVAQPVSITSADAASNTTKENTGESTVVNERTPVEFVDLSASPEVPTFSAAGPPQAISSHQPYVIDLSD